MKTNILEICDENLKTAAEIIKSGGLVAFPTETVYGLGANAFNEKAVSDIFKAKGRPSDNPLIVHVNNKEMINMVAEYDENTSKLIDAFMPGSLTIVMKKKSVVPDIVTAGLDTVAIRMPLSIEARSFISYCQLPIAAPSANTSKRPSPTDAETVYEDMNGKIPCILKGKVSSVGIESTVIDMAHGKPMILRPGKITASMITEKTGIAVSYLPENADLSKVNSPGLKYKHYAPKCPMYLNTDGDLNKINDFIKKEETVGNRVAILCSRDIYNKLNSHGIFFDLGSNPEEAMHNLFEKLREAEKQCDVIIAVYTDKSEESNGINNRIKKSCGGNIL